MVLIAASLMGLAKPFQGLTLESLLPLPPLPANKGLTRQCPCTSGIIKDLSALSGITKDLAALSRNETSC